jgi:hypothetical protein
MKTTTIAALGLLFAAAQAEAAECGTIKLYDDNNTRQAIFPVELLEIDGDTQFRRGYMRPLSVGKHTLKLGEKIPPAELSQQVARFRDRSIRNRELEIDVQPNVLYVIGAKFIREKRDEPKEYWAPIVLRDEGHPCTLK